LFGLMAMMSLIECKWNLGQWLAEKFSNPLDADPINEAQELSIVLQIPIVDAELTLELSRVYFRPTDNAKLNSEALELFLAPAPHNESWRTRAGECCHKLRALEPSAAPNL
jgi:hypothetical protein